MNEKLENLFNLYKNEWESIRFKEALELYDSNFNLLEDERMLFDILISIPYKISDKDSEYERCREFRKLINYLGKSSLLIKDD